MDNSGMIFNFDDGTNFKATQTTAMVMIDETGDEQLSDPHHRLFGMGGCCILAENYSNQMEKPWKEIMRNHFIENGKPFHASGMRSIGVRKQEVINNFFADNRFGRFASIISDQSQNYSDYELVELVYAALHLRIVEILKHTNFSNIIVIHEDSERLIEKLKNGRLNTTFTENVDGKSVAIETLYCKMNKRSAFAGLEIADYIMHAVGQTVRDKNRGKFEKFIDNPKFKGIFGTGDNKLSSFVSIDEIRTN